MFKIIPLLFLSVPAFTQLVGTYTYHSKEVHNITIINDTTWNWNIDTINYQVPFEIKFTKTAINIDGYGTFKFTKYEVRGSDQDSLPFYTLSNGGSLMKVYGSLYLEYPVVNKKTKMIFFTLDKQ